MFWFLFCVYNCVFKGLRYPPISSLSKPTHYSNNFNRYKQILSLFILF